MRRSVGPPALITRRRAGRFRPEAPRCRGISLHPVAAKAPTPTSQNTPAPAWRLTSPLSVLASRATVHSIRKAMAPPHPPKLAYKD